jgi:pyrroline-5-carboxylate reductase
MMKVGFVGGGKMAEAIIADLVNSRILNAHDIFVCDICEDRRRTLKRRHGVNVFADNSLLLGVSTVVFLAVKPQNLDGVLAEIAPSITNEHLVISIAAGKRLAHIEALLPDAKVVRVMPNLCALISEGMSVFCTGERVTVADRKSAVTLLSCFGQVLELPEEQFDAVTALSGSGPAFFAHFLELMMEAGEQLGLRKKDAALLAEQTMLGTAMLLVKGEFSTADLIKAVSSAKGTTVAGMAVLDKSPIKSIVCDTLEAAARRSKELSSTPEGK